MDKKELESLRKQIDALDGKIVQLIQERANIGKQIGDWKRENNEPIYNPVREKEVYSKILKGNSGPLSDDSLKSIYREIMSGTIAIEHNTKIGYLGPIGSFSHEAVRKKFGDSIEAIPFSTIPEIFRAVESGQLDYGVVPVENSSEGLVNSTLDQLLLTDLLIYSETMMKISFHLLGFEDDLSKIKRLYGIKIGNEQCRNWIYKNLPGVEIIETSSTAAAAKLVSEQKEGAAVASSIAADIYGLKKIVSHIEDIAGNTTRFLVLGKEVSPPTDSDKTSIAFSVPDKPGALYSVLKIFFENEINLSKIESRPSRRNLWEYNFFIDFVGHFQDKKIHKILKSAKPLCTFLKVLGSYHTETKNHGI